MKRKLGSPGHCPDDFYCVKMSRLLQPMVAASAPKQESMMVVWTDGKPTTVIRNKPAESQPPPQALPFQYKIPLSKYNTLTHAANSAKRRSTTTREDPSRPENGNDIYPRRAGLVSLNIYLVLSRLISMNI